MSGAGEEANLLARLRGGDEGTFASLIDDCSGAMLRLARTWASDRRAAFELVRDAWVELVASLDRLDPEVPLRASVLRQLARRAEADRPGDASGRSDAALEPPIEPWRFVPATSPGPGRWEYPPVPWPQTGEPLASEEGRRVVQEALDALPASVRQVVVLADVVGLPLAEVAWALGLDEAEARARLNSGRGRVHQALELHLQGL